MDHKILFFISVISIFVLISGCSEEKDMIKTSFTLTEEVVISNQEKAVPSAEENKEEVTRCEESTEDVCNPEDILPAEADHDFETFHYQLQSTDYENLKELDVDLIVIDIDDACLEPYQLTYIKNSGKKVLSYLSIGEAEDYRSYWEQDWTEGNPEFLDEENPDWEGNYKVKYWYPEWQDMILDRVRVIAEAGYDGVYLDIIDAYEYYEEQGRSTARSEMVDFVNKISEKGKNINPDFLIVPQNSPELYEIKEYKRAIDGLGKESTWYENDEQQDIEETETVLSYLDQAVQDGKFVLAIDYPTEQDNVCDFYEKCRSHDFVCIVSNLELDINEPIECDE